MLSSDVQSVSPASTDGVQTIAKCATLRFCAYTGSSRENAASKNATHVPACTEGSRSNAKSAAALPSAATARGRTNVKRAGTLASACTAGRSIDAEIVGVAPSARTTSGKLTAKTVAVAASARTPSGRTNATSANSLGQRWVHNSWLASTLPRETGLKKVHGDCSMLWCSMRYSGVDGGRWTSICKMQFGTRLALYSFDAAGLSESGRAFIHFYLVYVSILFSSAARNQHPPHHPILVQQVGSDTDSLSQ